MPLFVQSFRELCQAFPDAFACALVNESGTISSSRSRRDLDQRARAIAAFLQAHTVPGDRVLLVFPQSLEFIDAFLGCLYARVIAVPATPPRRNRGSDRLGHMVADCAPRLVLTVGAICGRLETYLREDPHADEIHCFAVESISGGMAANFREEPVLPEEIAFLQYTSGSTSDPKGVMVSQSNLAANLADLERRLLFRQDSVAVSWLPMFHDMGLILGVLEPLRLGIPLYLLSPETFIRRPASWLETISRFRGSHTAAPNFAYELCVESIQKDEISGLDLSCWKVAMNGAEPVRRATVAKFVEKFANCGLSAATLCPGYGLAECTLEVVCGRAGEAAHFMAVSSASLEQGLLRSPKEEADTRYIACCGMPEHAARILIVEPERGSVCSPGQVGEIWVSGPSVAAGYWGKQALSRLVFEAQPAGESALKYLRTGDLGFLHEGQLYITGRLKDLLIVRGRNYYPQDIEFTVQGCSPFLRADRGAAFSIDNGAREELVVVQELNRHTPGLDPEQLFQRIQSAVSEEHGIDVDEIVLIRYSSLPVTSSGKIQRVACRKAFLKKMLPVKAQWRRNQSGAVGPQTATAEVFNEAERKFSAWLMRRLALRLRIPENEIETDQPIARYGLNSVIAVQLAGDISEHSGAPFDASLLYQHSTVEQVARFIVTRGQEPSGKPEPAAAPAAAIAVIGMGCRFPGAKDPHAFWRILESGKDCVCPLPESREDLRARYQALSARNMPVAGGFLDQVDLFDFSLFGMSQREADFLDPQQRLLLETTWEAIENTGTAPNAWRGEPVGVFIGISGNDYGQLMKTEYGLADPHAAPGISHSLAANRLSYFFDWRGPSLSLDTACSSSLVAVHKAYESIRNGECSLAIAGGVNVILDPEITAAFYASGMLSPDGRCKTFDERADGYVRGEGCGAVVLKALDAALRDGNRVLAVIRGSAMNHNGRSNGITAPSATAQQVVIEKALRAAALHPSDLSYVEAHGTGTLLGDPIEVQALASVLKQGASGHPPCWIGSVKTNIGHLEAAAGIAGLIKVVLMLTHQAIPPNLHWQQPNSHMAGLGECFHFPVKIEPWNANGRRYGGVSSFGFGGANAHVILEEAPEQRFEAPTRAVPAALLTISGESEFSLKENARRWVSFIEERGDLSADAFGFYSNTARAHLRFRLCVAAASNAALAGALRSYLNGQPDLIQSGTNAPLKLPRIVLRLKASGMAESGLGKLLGRYFPVFEEAFGECARANGGAAMGPAVSDLALAYSSLRLWASWGIKPEASAADNVGGLAIAAVQGSISLRQAIKDAGANVVPHTHETPATHGSDVVFALSPLHAGENELLTTFAELGKLFINGVPIDWKAFHQGMNYPPVDLPTYAFDRRRCWFQTDRQTQGRPAESQVESGMPVLSIDGAERKLTEIIAKAMRVDSTTLDPEARFTEMGADSLIMISAIRRVEEIFGVKIAIRQLFEETPNIRRLAPFVVEHARNIPSPGSLNIPALPQAPQGSSLREIVTRQSEAVKRLSDAYLELARQVQSPGTFRASGIAIPPGLAATIPEASSSLPPWKALGREPQRAAQQKQHLDNLIARYAGRTQGSKKLAQEARERLADNRASAGFRMSTKEMLYPMVWERAKGAYIWDVDGNSYLDITMGFGVHLFGHAPEFLAAALEEELRLGSPLGPQTRLAGKVAELVHQITGMDRCYFCNTGTEAVMTALRLARAATSRKQVVIFEGAYHGNFDGVLASARRDGGRIEPQAMTAGTPPGMIEEIIPLPYGDDFSLEIIRQLGSSLAAVLVEPVQSRHPGHQPQEFLHALRAITETTGTILIFDEMITGFRISPGGAQEYFNVRADLATYGKIAGGGQPIGIVAGRSSLMDRVDGGFWQFGDASFPEVDNIFLAGTFNKHPLTMAAAHSVLGQIVADNGCLHRQLNQKTSELASALNHLFSGADVPIRIEHFGSLFRFQYFDNQDVFIYHLLQKGIFIWEGRNCFLSTAHSEADLEYIAHSVEETLREMKGGGYFPSPEKPAPAITEFKLSPDQRQLLWLAALSPRASVAYNESAVLRLDGPFDPATLSQALNSVVEHHEALHTWLGPGECQNVRNAVVDLCEIQVQEEFLQRELAGFINRPFDFSFGAPFRAGLFKISPSLYYLALCGHHAAVDGISMALIVKQIGECYSAFAAGSEPQMPPCGTFREFLLRREERSLVRTENLKFWLSKYRPPLPRLDLPADFPRPPLRTFAGGAIQETISPELAHAVAVFARSNHATSFMAFLAAYLLLLHRLSEQQDIIAAVPVSGREDMSDGSVAGFCAYMLPVRSNCQMDESIRQYFQRLRLELLEAYEHQDFSLPALLEELKLPFDPSRPTLFSATFNLDQSEKLEGIFPIGASLAQQTVSFTKFDLSLNLMNVGDELRISLEYAADLFSEKRAHRILRWYKTMLETLLSVPEIPAGDVDLLSPAERKLLFEERNDTSAASLPFTNVVEWFEAQAVERKEEPAVVFENLRLTYGELSDRSSQLAAYLRSLGISQEKPVGICLQPGPDLPVAMLAVLRAGGFYVPLDPGYPQSRIEQTASDVGVRLVLTHSGCAEKCRALPGTLIVLDELAGEAPRPGLEQTAVCHSPEQLAYTIYTSGSTGRPKGVSVSHGALLNLLASMAREPGVRPSEVFLSVTPLSFDIAGLEILLPLVTGGTLCLAPLATRRDGHALANLLESSGASTMQATPSTWKLLLESGWKGMPRLKALCGGEELPSELARQLRPLVLSLWNMYGPTETTIWSAVREIASPSQPIDLGLPIANTQFYVLDSRLQPVPVGVPGELVIGGNGLARGYWRQPEITAAGFVPDPFSTHPGARMYRTGDLVRLHDDSRLEYLGRMDSQVKIHGHRIELGEIVAVLEWHSSISQAAVIVKKGAGGTPSLAAFLVAAGADRPAVPDLRATVEQKLPAYMVPAEFRFVDRLPLSLNGKLDRNALAAIKSEEAPRGTTFAPPENDVERILSTIWKETLARTQIGVNDNFFDLGGNSLALTLVHARIQNELQLEFPVIEMLKFPNIRGLARHLGRDSQPPEPALDAELEHSYRRAERRRLTLQSRVPVGKEG